MKSSLAPPSVASSGFTLVELVTVLTLIAVLISMLIAAVGGANEMARRARAKSDVAEIVAAVKAYHNEYAGYPITGEQSGAEVSFTTDNTELFNALRAIPEGYNAEHALNPRRIVFVEIPSASNPAQPHAGIAHGCWYDPWGPQPGKAESGVYHVRLDGASSGQVTDPYPGRDPDDQPGGADDGAPVIHEGVIAWCLAKGGVQTYELLDQVVSWK